MAPDRDPSLYLPLAPHSFQILLSLLERDLHGYSLIRNIEERTGGEVVLGTSTVYAAVRRMVKDGLLAEAPPPREDSSGGPKRRYYRITDLGRVVAQAEGLRIERLHRMVVASSLLEGGGETAPEEVRS